MSRLEVAGSRVVITGAGSGIGAAAATLRLGPVDVLVNNAGVGIARLGAEQRRRVLVAIEDLDPDRQATLAAVLRTDDDLRASAAELIAAAPERLRVLGKVASVP